MNRLCALLDRIKRTRLTLFVTPCLTNLYYLNAKRRKTFDPLIFVALAKLRPQGTQLILEDNWSWQLTRGMLNIAPERVAAERLCKEVSLVEGLLVACH
jgi:hypothetical protein